MTVITKFGVEKYRIQYNNQQHNVRFPQRDAKLSDSWIHERHGRLAIELTLQAAAGHFRLL